MDKKPEKLVPEVRFKGFTDDWEQRKLGEVGKTFTGLSGKTKEDFGHGNAYFVTYMNVYSNPISNSNMVENVEIDTKQQEVKKGDVFFTTSSETPEEVGMSSVWLDDKPNTYLNSFCFGFRPMRNIFNFYYLAYLLRSNNIRNKMIILAQGISRYNISKNKVMELEVAIPKIKEQQKIGEFFKQLDSLITLQQRKLEILIKLKQSFLTKSMANNLDKNPELYFNSASIKWLKQKLSNLTIKEFKGNTKLNDTKPGKTEYLDAERLNGNAPLFIDKPINTLKSDILILWDGSKAGSVYYGFEGSLGSTLKAIRLNPKLVNSFFVYQQLKSKQDVIFNKYRTPNIPHVIKNFTKVYPIYFPSMAVQNKIARFLGNLDALIEIQQKSIKDYKGIKKYLLQKLFI
ncbi:restriction endonuclease subunit S [Limosilactobacillus sp. WF-MT5-A]|uniref:restriction endonuclease subunit S n=1 Tax=Limosilactobacillus agrestis TaxID=2759748 RepID=UPI0015FA01F7|nr:restriction endonuclease subunit S [Limosilactobacillus agrestis]MBB1099573.1 restriction endonuclease subunit S [Limosilactobacillus agrestis]